MPILDTSLIRILLIDSHAIVRAGLRLLLESFPGFQVVGEAGNVAEAVAVAKREQPDIIIFEAAAEVPELEEIHLSSTNGSTLDGNPTAVVETPTAVATTATMAEDSSDSVVVADFVPSPLFTSISSSAQITGSLLDSVDFIPALFEAAPDAQIVVLTGSNDPKLHRRVVAQGAKGLLQKDCSPEVLMRAVECVYTGEVWIERTMMASVLAELAQTGGTAASVSRSPVPTEREREVIVLLCEGLPNRQIAARLCISETTVRRHLTTIFSKLGVSDRLELVIYAYRHGLAGLPG